MSTQTESRKFPTPVYAAAGAGDVAYQQLRKLPEKVAELRGRVAELRPVAAEAVSERSLRADLDRLRETARRSAVAVVNGAQAAQERAVTVYTDLVARGERVVAGAREAEAKAQLATAQAETRSARTAEAKAPTADVKAPTAEAEAAEPEAVVASEKAVRRPRPATTVRQ